MEHFGYFVSFSLSAAWLTIAHLYTHSLYRVGGPDKSAILYEIKCFQFNEFQMSQINKRCCLCLCNKGTRRRRRTEGRDRAIHKCILKIRQKPKITHCFLRFASTYSGWVCVCVRVRALVMLADYFCHRLRVCDKKNTRTYKAIWILCIVPAISFRYCISKLSWFLCFVLLCFSSVSLAVCLSCWCCWTPLLNQRDLVLLSCFHSSLCEFNTSHGHTCCTRSGD